MSNRKYFTGTIRTDSTIDNPMEAHFTKRQELISLCKENNIEVRFDDPLLFQGAEKLISVFYLEGNHPEGYFYLVNKIACPQRIG